MTLLEIAEKTIKLVWKQRQDHRPVLYTVESIFYDAQSFGRIYTKQVMLLASSIKTILTDYITSPSNKDITEAQNMLMMLSDSNLEIGSQIINSISDSITLEYIGSDKFIFYGKNMKQANTYNTVSNIIHNPLNSYKMNKEQLTQLGLDSRFIAHVVKVGTVEQLNDITKVISELHANFHNKFFVTKNAEDKLTTMITPTHITTVDIVDGKIVVDTSNFMLQSIFQQ